MTEKQTIFGPRPLASPRADDPRQTMTGTDQVLDKRADNSTRQNYPLTVTKQMISDFESYTGFFGLGKKMVAAGFWRLS